MATSAAYIDLDEGAAPATPAAGKVRVYAKTDGSTYQKDDAGTETGLASSGAGLGAWTTYTPTLTATTTNPTLGDGTLSGRYKLLDANTVSIQIHFIFGSTSNAGSGTWQFALPSGMTAGAVDQALAGHLIDVSTRAHVISALIEGGATVTSRIAIADAASHTVTSGNPAWATGDELVLSGIIEVA